MAPRKAALPHAAMRVSPSAGQIAAQPGDIIAARRRPAGMTSGRPPAAHRFHPGETVTLAPNRYGQNRNGRFKVVRLLPEEHGINHYRLKSVTDGHERVASEDELI
jgi:hypothetical protein